MKKKGHSIKSAIVIRKNLAPHEKSRRTPRHAITLLGSKQPIGMLDINRGFPKLKSGKLAREVVGLIEDGLKFRAGKQALKKYLKANSPAVVDPRGKSKKKRKIRKGDTWQSTHMAWNLKHRRYEGFDVTVTCIDGDKVNYRYDKFPDIGLQVTTRAIFAGNFTFVRRFIHENS